MRRDLHLIFMIAAISVPALAVAGPCSGSYYFRMRQDVETTVLDNQGRLKSRKRLSVTDVFGTPDAPRSTISTKTYDAGDKLAHTAFSEARCGGNDLLLDVGGGLPAQGGSPLVDEDEPAQSWLSSPWGFPTSMWPSIRSSAALALVKT